ncbi:hypothetical protein [Brucella gallinifaecis]|uniref:hypothetical protein n=1 Tax=Brucella gallinifaecis TaxID=215590 RepID=UPI002361FE57|nr:hypothetical protein [Brucella gallinifaecis]
MSKHWYIYGIVALIFSATQLFAKRTAPRLDGDVSRLKPPILFFLMIPAAGLIFLFLLGVALKQGPGEDFWIMIALLSFFPLAMAVFTYFCFSRQIYWDAEGIGSQNPFGKKFIRWNEIKYGGKGFDGGYVVKSSDTTIRYIPLENGYEVLNKEIRKRCPPSKVNF